MKPKMSKMMLIDMIFIATIVLILGAGLYFMYLINTCSILCF